MALRATLPASTRRAASTGNAIVPPGNPPPNSGSRRSAAARLPSPGRRDRDPPLAAAAAADVTSARSSSERGGDFEHSDDVPSRGVAASGDGSLRQPHHARQQPLTPSTPNEGGAPDRPPTAGDSALRQQFWRTYDTIIILSICAVGGIAFRMASAAWFRLELGAVFSADSALGGTLPLNVWSCFLMGLLCSGREAIGIVHSKFLGGANLYGSGRGILEVGQGAYRGVVNAGRSGVHRARGFVRGTDRERKGDHMNLSSDTRVEETPNSVHSSNPNLHRRRGNDHAGANATSPTAASGESIACLLGLDDEFRIVGSLRDSEEEVREVQLRGLTRRILASPSLVLFRARKQDMDVVEHYEDDGALAGASPPSCDERFDIGDLGDDEASDIELSVPTSTASGEVSGQHEDAVPPLQSESSSAGLDRAPSLEDSDPARSNRQLPHSTSRIEGQVDDMIHSITDGVTTLRRVRLLDGWNVDTSPDKMKDILLLGLRVGFCGALSTFSSLNASVIRLLREGALGEALVTIILTIELGIVSYRFGQYLAVYIFVWRCRRETSRDERRGYGLRLRGLDTDEEPPLGPEEPSRRTIPSVRTAATLVFVAMFVSLCLAIYFSTEHGRTQYWCSLLFTPFGCLARFALMNKYNKRLPGFPLGTFSCNLLSCALSGSLGSFLAGNPGPEESLVLTSMIAGFAGSLSTFATFIVEILSLMDPIIFKFDGMVYAVITVLWAVIIGYVGSQAKNWADEI